MDAKRVETVSARVDAAASSPGMKNRKQNRNRLLKQLPVVNYGGRVDFDKCLYSGRNNRRLLKRKGHKKKTGSTKMFRIECNYSHMSVVEKVHELPAAMCSPTKRTQWRQDLQHHGFSKKLLLNCCLVRRIITWASPIAKGAKMSCRKRCKREIFKFAQYLFRLITGTLNTVENVDSLLKPSHVRSECLSAVETQGDICGFVCDNTALLPSCHSGQNNHRSRLCVGTLVHMLALTFFIDWMSAPWLVCVTLEGPDGALQLTPKQRRKTTVVQLVQSFGLSTLAFSTRWQQNQRRFFSEKWLKEFDGRVERVVVFLVKSTVQLNRKSNDCEPRRQISETRCIKCKSNHHHITKCESMLALTKNLGIRPPVRQSLALTAENLCFLDLKTPTFPTFKIGFYKLVSNYYSVEDELELSAVRHRPEGLEQLEAQTRFSRKELQILYRGFKNECPSGVVNEETFKDIYSQFFPQGDASTYAHFLFNAFDTDHNGSISFEDFVMGLSILLRGTVQEKLNWAFNLYDINKDGYITKEEMLDIMKAIYDMMGKCTYPVLKDEAPRQHVEVFFQKMDKNKDGVVTIDEFIDCCQNVSRMPRHVCSPLLLLLSTLLHLLTALFLSVCRMKTS
ncbi:hypothetical protein F2P81_018494 [Scophthalmus maximus]|uniref:Kv channel-interacting protein 4 n=1 Tax=Scophthalmus maximus TaxID=52904 RepID=A0A6A4S9Y8_SCOMX|nr:hypothetical protein F2P81_018494 [Scophthalmus maximus]